MGLSTVGGARSTSIDLPNLLTGEQSAFYGLSQHAGGEQGVMCSFLPTVELATKIFFSSAQREAPQVYNQNLYTRIVVVLTTALFCG